MLRSSAPVHTPVTKSGVTPINHASELSLVVPVLPPIGYVRPPNSARRRRLAVPPSTTPLSMSTMIYADSLFKTFFTSGLFSYNTVPSLVSTRKIIIGLRSEEHTSELQSRENLVCRLLLEKKNN